MPIFEYICKDCSRTFEALVMDSKQPECPACHGQQLEQLLSTFAPRASSAAPRRAQSVWRRRRRLRLLPERRHGRHDGLSNPRSAGTA